MGLSSSIQFRDKESVLEAYNSRGVKAWSIVCGKQFMFKGIGPETFETIINILDDGVSSATYTAQVYEDIEDEKQIKNNTPCDGSFNFKFNEEIRNTYNAIRGIGNGNGSNEVLSKLNAIDARLTEMESEPAESDNDGGLGMIGKILNHPALLPVAPKIIEGIIGAILGPGSNLASMIGNAELPGHQENEAPILERLKSHDPNLERHLQKLLALAETDNGTFQQIIKAFD